jgi:hypothetical protein
VSDAEIMNSETAKTIPVIGWREWIRLPDLGISSIKAKIDTGARSSSLHAVEVETFHRDGRTFVRFQVHPLQRTSSQTIEAEAEVLEFRRIRSSSGHATMRPVIVTTLEVLGRSWPIEVTLADRADMGFRMLLGREAVRSRLLVDPGRSYYNGRPPRPRRVKGG